MRAKDAVGRYGEDVAAAHVEASGWRVLDRNWRCRYGELDLVGMDGDELVVVEVKTRRSTAYGTPAEAVTWRKLARIRRLAAQWLAEHDLRVASVRVDVIAVLLPRAGAAQVEHLRGVC
ncbi:YraN family protein [Cellulomonas sp. PSBB021]|uniref:YraN family protein n=1 Tax=Cellulomonas sp. PSBB021 TaxID=2003551 RepID=UPI000B8D7B23|nr:YraN family protein [Cellulomonas sp. PSBB021]ASR56652.1 YraN family protein [Cellulomonas sp. PSBB021]